MRLVGLLQVVELDGTHGDGGGHKMVNQVLQLGKEEREK
jgi:hypothetical protein